MSFEESHFLTYEDVARVLERFVIQSGALKFIRSDKDSEIVFCAAQA
ncbi:hypothetical protein [Haloferula sp.]